MTCPGICELNRSGGLVMGCGGPDRGGTTGGRGLTLWSPGGAMRKIFTLIRAHGLLNRAHGLLNRAHELVIRAHDLVIRAHGLA